MIEAGSPRARSSRIRRWRRIHEWTGLLAGVWIAFIALTGIALNHSEQLGLLDSTISNSWIPAHYTDEFHSDSTVVAVVLADLHSGQFFGELGGWVGDLAGVALLISVVTGGYVYLARLWGRAGR